eukprot:TRINITY_DN411_c0_g1_i1.p1 TRINITY_DN411_c0_g1~~TRINITY_DN411_c0_g1_i1.p1  ORF type:complete len:1006 (-),score=83.67 TRINITY_DN411_c0_g1_i1:3692-6709(-)
MYPAVRTLQIVQEGKAPASLACDGMGPISTVSCKKYVRIYIFERIVPILCYLHQNKLYLWFCRGEFCELLHSSWILKMSVSEIILNNLKIKMNPGESYEEQQNTLLEYKKALNAACEQLKRLKNEKDNLQDVYEEFKQHYEKLKKECNEISKRHMDTIAEKKHIEAEYEAQLKHLRGLLEQRERILDEQRTKALLPTDTDMLRAKIAREIEAPYKQKVDTLNQEIDRLESDLSETRRSNALLKSELEANELDYSRQINDLKHKHQGQMADLMAELQLLHEKLDDTRDKEMIRTMKREIEEYKRKSLDAQREAAELRKQRDELKLEKSTVSIEHAKQIEQVRAGERRAQDEVEDLQLKIQKMEEELTRELQAGVEKGEQIQQLTESNNLLKEKLQECELELSQCRTQSQAAETRAKEHEDAVEAYAKRLQEEEKERSLFEREDKAKLQQEVERLEKELMHCEEARKSELQDLSDRLEGTEREKRVLQEEYKMTRKKLADLQGSFENIKLTHIKALDARDKLENELAKLQERYRNLLTKEQELATAKEHLEFSIKSIEEEYHKLTEEKRLWGNERAQLQTQISELAQRLENATKRDDVNMYKRKATEYKNKVRQANLKLQQMAAKLARLQAESFAMGEYRPIPAEVIMKPQQEPVGEKVYNVKQLESEIEETLGKNKEVVELQQVLIYESYVFHYHSRCDSSCISLLDNVIACCTLTNCFCCELWFSQRVQQKYDLSLVCVVPPINLSRFHGLHLCFSSNRSTLSIHSFQIHQSFVLSLQFRLQVNTLCPVVFCCYPNVNSCIQDLFFMSIPIIYYCYCMKSLDPSWKFPSYFLKGQPAIQLQQLIQDELFQNSQLLHLCSDILWLHCIYAAPFLVFYSNQLLIPQYLLAKSCTLWFVQYVLCSSICASSISPYASILLLSAFLHFPDGSLIIPIDKAPQTADSIKRSLGFGSWYLGEIKGSLYCLITFFIFILYTIFYNRNILANFSFILVRINKSMSRLPEIFKR